MIENQNFLDQTSVVRAKVESNKDPDKIGRVQVSYPWMFNSDSIISEWARVCQPAASKNSGTWFISNVGDEVLALIENGDLNSPIILGHLYSESNTPPTSSLGNKPGTKYFMTASGTQIVLDDESDTILLESSSGAKLKLEKNKIALGSGGDEILDMTSKMMEAIINAAPTFCSTSVGPGVLNPQVVQKLTELKMKLDKIKGDL
jgi:uncharacterized protein involved in type VI secretion and phage assembly